MHDTYAEISLRTVYTKESNAAKKRWRHEKSHYQPLGVAYVKLRKHDIFIERMGNGVQQWRVLDFVDKSLDPHS